jgi:hypothetical protein
MPPGQSPKLSLVGTSNAPFVAQKPFTNSAQEGPALGLAGNTRRVRHGEEYRASILARWVLRASCARRAEVVPLL